MNLQEAFEIAEEAINNGVILDRFLCEDPDDIWGEFFILSEALLALRKAIIKHRRSNWGIAKVDDLLDKDLYSITGIKGI